MDARISSLEQGLSEVKGSLSNVRERLSHIEGQLQDMPTKDWMNTRLLSYIGAAVAIIGVMVRFLGR